MAKNDYAPKTGSKVKLREYDPDDKGGISKEDAVPEMLKLHERLETLQEMLYAQSKQALLIVLQAMDTGGKDGTVKSLFSGITPSGLRVTSFKAPTAEELAHDFLWRVHQAAPPKGYIGVFNRSHYEDVLIVRVNKLAPDKVWKKRYDQINEFEQLLSDNGTRIVKFYLHISKDEQKQRLLNRLNRPDKQWKFAVGDLPVREKWDDYMAAYEDAITKCNTSAAPWVVVPANHKWYRDLIVIRTVVNTLESMGLSYPPPEPGLDKVVIPD
ncbi:MAG TPA: polyphosphate kinase 2 family protein [Phototrophicaceae bacterium]|jgi:PPK2 family polyphosphate:nucleotide phosphotransferase|nr:polyphosphate kinase 2 family protein [Phototrophicaceae bacterium]